MNQQEFERLCYNQQEFLSKSFLKDQASTDQDAALVDEVLALDEKLVNLMAVDVPKQLQDKIIAQVPASPPSKSSRFSFETRQVLAMAASFFILVGASFWLWQQNDISRLENSVFAHLYHEPYALERSADISALKVNQLLAPFNAELNESMDAFGYAEVCDIKNKKSVHLVLQTSNGPVTVFIMPTESLTRLHLIQDKKFKGMMYPSKNGSVAIVSTSQKAVESVKLELDKRLTWNI